jgi:hypothetical protein
VLIEADKRRYGDLLKRHADNPKVISMNRFVGFTGSDSLDVLLRDTPVPKDFDVLSIDIDGNDHHVWNAVSAFVPKIVCIEYNNTIPNEVQFVQAADPRLNQGSSLSALVQLARSKGYDLVCVTFNNAVFVRSEYYSLFKIPDNSPAKLREDLSAVTYLFCGYDGTIMISGKNWIAHHGEIRISPRLRQLPSMFRKYPPNFSRVQEILYKFYWRAARLLGRG